MISLREGLMLGAGGVISLVGAGGKTTLMFRLARELAAAGEAVLTTTTTNIYTPSPEQSGSLIVSESPGCLLDKLRDGLNSHRHITAAARRLSRQGKLSGFTSDVIQNIWESQIFNWIIVEADGAAGRPLKAPAEYEPVISDCTSLCVGMVGLSVAGQPANPDWVFRHGHFQKLSGLAAGATVTPAAIADVLVHEMGIFKTVPADSMRIAFCNQADSPRNLAAGRQIARLLIQKERCEINRVVIGQALRAPPITEFHDLNSKPRK